MTNHSTTSPVLLRRIKTAQKSLGRVRHLPIYIFVKELVANPRNIGAACPSSKKLADSIASLVSPPQDGYVVELGAGTGVVTAALLRRGISPERLIVVEKSKHLANMLKKSSRISVSYMVMLLRSISFYRNRRTIVIYLFQRLFRACRCALCQKTLSSRSVSKSSRPSLRTVV